MADSFVPLLALLSLSPLFLSLLLSPLSLLDDLQISKMVKNNVIRGLLRQKRTILGYKKVPNTNDETNGDKKPQSTLMKTGTMNKSPSANGDRRGRGREIRTRSKSSEKTQLTIIEAARGRRKERSKSREAKARRVAETGKASSRPSRS